MASIALLLDRVLGSVDEAGEVAIVEVAEPVHLVRRREGAVEPRDDRRRELEAEVHPLGADVEEEIARGRDRMPCVRDDLTQRMELGWTWRPEEDVPGV